MPHAIRQELQPIVEAIEILSPAAFRFRSETVAVPPGPVQPIPGLPNHPLPQMPLTRELQAQLYGRCYSRRLDDSQPIPPFASDPSHLQRLSGANRSQSRYESGWTVYTVAPSGQVYVQKGDRQRSAMPGEYLTSGAPGMPPQTGTAVTLSVPRDSAIAQPGFYFLYGETLADLWDDHHLLRFYFHATAESAPALLEYLTTELNRFQVPFRMKALIEPCMYFRTDAVVLYVARRFQQIAVRIMLRMPAGTAGQLRASTPLFTLPVAPGIGLAEEPNTGESFGMHRCRLTAEALVEAWKSGAASIPERIAAVEAQFRAAGLNLDLPYLSPASTDLEPSRPAVEFAHA